MKKNDNYPKYVQAMRLMDEGMTPNYVSVHLKMGRSTIQLVRQRYLKGGELALMYPTYQPHHELCKKIEIVKDILENGLSLSEASLKHDVQRYTIKRWIIAYQKSGESGLIRRNASRNMAKKRQRTEAEMDELEMLRKRNEYLEAENALLKKVKALVEEREARLRAIGRKPSKD